MPSREDIRDSEKTEFFSFQDKGDWKEDE